MAKPIKYPARTRKMLDGIAHARERQVEAAKETSRRVADKAAGITSPTAPRRQSLGLAAAVAMMALNTRDY